MSAIPSNKIIGGMFGLESPIPVDNLADVELPRFLTSPHIKLATGRSAFSLLNSLLSPKNVWLPAYLCGVVMGAFPARQTRIKFYPIDENLQVTDDSWLTEVAGGDMVVFIDYFGFNLWSEYGAEVRRRGAWVVEDACQALLNKQFCEHSHYVVFSPRKFVGVPDGGILLAQGDAKLPEVNLPTPPTEWWLAAFTASQLRAEFDRHGGERKWFELFRKSDPSGPLQPVRMSELSQWLLPRLDWSEICIRRRENYLHLASQLGSVAMFPDLPAGIVPIGFPIKLKQRDEIRQRLFSHEIYPPVHWPVAGVVPAHFAASHRLNEVIMTLPCDQRCQKTDLERMISLLAKNKIPSKG